MTANKRIFLNMERKHYCTDARNARIVIVLLAARGIRRAVQLQGFRAVSGVYEGVPTKVLSAEHLAAICVQTGRMKDKLRVEMFLRSAKFDKTYFLEILDHNNLPNIASYGCSCVRNVRDFGIIRGVR